MDKGRELRWSKEVNGSNNGKCIHCSSTDTMACHIIPRGNHRTAFVLENGIPGCKKFHDALDLKGEESRKVMVARFCGPDRYENLERISLDQATAEEFGYTIIE